MSERIAFKTKLIVDEETARILDGQSKILNKYYNLLVDAAIEIRNDWIARGAPREDPAALVVYSLRGLRNWGSENLVPSLPYLRSVHSSPRKNAALRLSRAIQAYQKSRKGQRAGDQTGWPGHRSWKKKWFSLEFDEPNKGFKILPDNQLRISLGKDAQGKQMSVVVGIKSTPRKGMKILACRITRENDGTFYAVFSIRRALPSSRMRKKKRVIAIDPNHKNLGYGVSNDGEAIEIENYGRLKDFDRRIDEVKSKRDRCKRKSRLVTFVRDDGSIHRHWEPSRRWKRYNQVLDRLYRQRRDQTKVYLRTIANRLCKEFDVIAVGNYVPHNNGLNKKMRRAMNNQSLIARFKTEMKWIAVRSGKEFVIYGEKGTTRSCCIPGCNFTHPHGIHPSVREWTCPVCHTHHIRDENAAINGLHIVLDDQTFMPGSGPSGFQRCTWSVMPSGIVSNPARA